MPGRRFWKPSPLDVIWLAGGRISGKYALAAGTEVKALAPLGAVLVIRRIVGVPRQTPGSGRFCVVGPEAVGEAAGQLAFDMDHLPEWEYARLLFA